MVKLFPTYFRLKAQSIFTFLYIVIGPGIKINLASHLIIVCPRLAQTQYVLRPAILPFSSNLSIQNPTKIVYGKVGEPSYTLYSDRSKTNIGSVYINASESIDYSFNSNNLTTVNCHLSTKDKIPASMNMTYWRKFEANISITTSTAYYILENGTYVENYTYVITNNENTHLTIGSLDFDRLGWENKVNFNRTQECATMERIYMLSDKF